MLQLISDWKFCYDDVLRLLSGPDPVFLGRIGGSDTNAIAALLEAEAEGRDGNEAVASHKSLVERYNGFYDLGGHSGLFLRYVAELAKECRRLRRIFFCNHQLISMYFPEHVRKDGPPTKFPERRGLELLVEAYESNPEAVSCYPYHFVEQLVLHPHTLMHVFGRVLEGKRVLVVSPFADSIAQNFERRFEFFRDFQYPEFRLELYNTPITYAGLPRDFYPHANWFETSEAIKAGISEIEFDIALMACGSYAVPLGNFIASTMKRKAVYVGGVLQLMFGVLGRRYENEFWLRQINREKFIYPVERDKYLKYFKITDATAREAFGAYF